MGPTLVIKIRLSHPTDTHTQDDAWSHIWGMVALSCRRPSTKSKKIIELFDTFEPDLVVETGTFIGTTTPLLATLSGAPVVTIELNPRLAARNSAMFQKHYPCLDIKQVIGSSDVELSKLLSTTPSSTRIFAYLDAHWFDYLPATDEIQALVNWGGKFIALIDDFHIEADEGYGWDEYISGQWIGKHLIPDDKHLSVFVPSDSSSREGLGRRGTAYIFGPGTLSGERHIDLSNLRPI